MRHAALVLIAIADTAFAHPNHPDGVVELLHLLTEPDHLALLLVPVVLVAIAFLAAKLRP